MRQHDDEVSVPPATCGNCGEVLLAPEQTRKCEACSHDPLDEAEAEAEAEHEYDGASSPLADLEAEDLARDAGDAALYPEAFDEGGDL